VGKPPEAASSGGALTAGSGLALDGLRGLSAQVVFIGHLLTILVPTLGAGTVHFLGWSARAAVIIFFCLSGFVITSSILRVREYGEFTLQDYIVRRIARIYPPYLLAIAVSWLAFLLVKGTEALSPVSFGTELLRALVFLNRGHDVVTQMDGPLWSLRLEVIAYAIAGLFAYTLIRRDLSRVLASISLVLAVASGGHVHLHLRLCISLLVRPRGTRCCLPTATFATTLRIARLACLVSDRCSADGDVDMGNWRLRYPAGDRLSDRLCGLRGVVDREPVRQRRELAISIPRTRRLLLYALVIHYPLLSIAKAAHVELPQSAAAMAALVLTTVVIVEGLALGVGRILERPRLFYAILASLLDRIRALAPSDTPERCAASVNTT
jgi:hypothetical protein